MNAEFTQLIHQHHQDLATVSSAAANDDPASVLILMLSAAVACYYCQWRHSSLPATESLLTSFPQSSEALHLACS
jgi:hypothetical protein